MNNDAKADLVTEPTGSIDLEPAWKQALGAQFQMPYMQNLRDFLRREKNAKKVIYPKSPNIFKAFDCTPLDSVKVVILGQDPYHGAGQAHGLCFSVSKGTALPPSLQNIYKELKMDLDIPPADHGCLLPWAQQGVLLLNSVLTVESGKPASHQGKGWELFTDKVIEILNQKKTPLVFVLWGAYAHRKGQVIDPAQHYVIQSAHPSPFSAYRGFFGSRPFSKINEFLTVQGQTPIDWALPPATALE